MAAADFSTHTPGGPPVGGDYEISAKQEHYQVREGKLFIGDTQCVVRKGGKVIDDTEQLGKIAELFNKTLNQSLELGKNQKLVVSDKGIQVLNTKGKSVDSVNKTLYAATSEQVINECKQYLGALKTDSVRGDTLPSTTAHKEPESEKSTRAERRSKGPPIDLGSDEPDSKPPTARERVATALKGAGSRAASLVKDAAETTRAALQEAKAALTRAASATLTPTESSSPQETTLGDPLEMARALVQEREEGLPQASKGTEAVEAASTPVVHDERTELGDEVITLEPLGEAGEAKEVPDEPSDFSPAVTGGGSTFDEEVKKLNKSLEDLNLGDDDEAEELTGPADEGPGDSSPLAEAASEVATPEADELSVGAADSE